MILVRNWIVLSLARVLGVKIKLRDGAPLGCSSQARGADLIACYPAPASHEKELHEDFKHCRLNGEWFWAHESLLEYLRMIGGDLDDSCIGKIQTGRTRQMETRRASI